MEYARKMLEKYSRPKDWDRVRFSDEVHFRGMAQHQLRIIRRPGERYCVECIQHKETPKEKDKKRFDCWAAVGYYFKSDLVFYDLPGNTNGKMSLMVYRDQILEHVGKPWLFEGKDFVLEEDSDSGDGKAQNRNIVQVWKSETISNTFSIMPLLQIFPLLRIAGCPPKATPSELSALG